MPSAHSIRTRRMAAVVAGILTTTAAVVLQTTGSLDPIERTAVDARFHVRGTQPPPPGLALVLIDAVTFDELRTRWPFPRSLHARVVDRLRAAGARVIAYDVQFSEPSVPEEDERLLRAVQRAGNVVLATTEVSEEGEPNVFGGGGVLEVVKATAGTANLTPDPGGVERRLRHSIEGLPAFAIAVAERATGRRVAPEALPRGEPLIDYAGPAGTVPSFSFESVLRGRVDPARLKGRIVVIGASAPTLHDIHVTPTAGSGLMSGPEVQANAIATVLDDFSLRSPWPPWGDTLVTVLLGLVIPFAGIRLLVGWAELTGFVVLGLYVVGAQLAFDQDHVLPVAGPATAVALNMVGAITAWGLSTALDRDRARQAFARFVPEAVVSEVLAQTDGARLGGEERCCTIMFWDIRGFTTYSETREAHVVIDVLNRYLGEVTEAVLDNGGTLLSFLGDGVMALFGAPLDQPDHADRALDATRDILDRVEVLNRWIVAEGHGEPFRIGIGLHTGPVVCGNVGSMRRLAYTAIGDAANTASRVEGLTKATGRRVLISERTLAAMTRRPGGLVRVGQFPIRGRVGSLELWGLSPEQDPVVTVAHGGVAGGDVRAEAGAGEA